MHIFLQLCTLHWFSTPFDFLYFVLELSTNCPGKLPVYTHGYFPQTSLLFIYLDKGSWFVDMATGSSALVSVADFEEYARRILPEYAFLYFTSGAEEEHTVEDNKNAFARFVISLLWLRQYVDTYPLIPESQMTAMIVPGKQDKVCYVSHVWLKNTILWYRSIKVLG